MEDLKVRIFRTIEKEIELKEFEHWLYKQSELSDRMDEDLILELFSFNYNQRGANYEFENRFLTYFDREEFTNWKIVANLKTLGEGCKEPERILSDFKDLSENGYSFLSHLGYAIYDLEECEFFGWDRPALIDVVRDESNQLLNELNDWLKNGPSKRLEDFTPKYQKLNITLPVRNRSQINSKKPTKWWEFWK